MFFGYILKIADSYLSAELRHKGGKMKASLLIVMAVLMMMAGFGCVGYVDTERGGYYDRDGRYQGDRDRGEYRDRERKERGDERDRRDGKGEQDRRDQRERNRERGLPPDYDPGGGG